MNSHFIGMMSGTSLDAVDGVLVAFDVAGGSSQLLKRASINLPKLLKEQLTFLAHSETLTFRQLAVAEDGLTRLYADCALQLLADLPKSQQPLAMGCHGQTLEHQPNLVPSYTLQLLNPSLLAELTGKNVIADFRRRDLAAGGQAAPLVPAFHNSVFRSANKDRVIINLGGIANLTFLPALLLSANPQQAVIGFDTGPANLLLDAWFQQHWQLPFDAEGKQAASGQVIPALLNTILANEYFARKPPKSTGRELFNPQQLSSWLASCSGSGEFAAKDVLRTLVEVTAVSLVDQIRMLDPKAIAEVFVCGGGWQNSFLRARIIELASPRPLASTEALGIPPQDVEAAAFAWLAWRHYHNKSGNLPSVTGAKGERVLGGFYPA
ncbi:MAG: anhydro-N-acetylmuramic acid kinase [Pseudomonadaceae bacterium]|nr:anhydro-N-acetylmuramic acid kinase [Pseudomonadaceae bacterium]